jgi:O-antigen/teichoic acid export membrane protein
MTTLRNILRSDKSLMLADQVIFSGGSFCSMLLLARVLGPALFGSYSSFLLIAYLILSIISALVIGQVQVLLHQQKNSKSYVSISFWMQLILVLFSCFVATILSFTPLENLLHIRQLGPGTILILFGFLFHDFFRRMLISQNQLTKSICLDGSIFFLQCSILTLSLQDYFENFQSVLFCLGLSYLPAIVYCIAKFQSTTFSRAEFFLIIRLHVKEGKWLTLSAIIQWLSGNYVILISGILLGLESLGAFRLVQSLFGILNAFLQMFENFVLPRMAKINAESVKKSKIYLFHITKKASYFFIPILIIMSLFPEYFIYIAGGEQYIGFAYIVQGMSLLYAIIFIGYPIRLAVRVQLINKAIFLAYLLSFLFSLVFSNLLLQNFQIAGLIAGLIVSQLIVLSYLQYTLIKNKFFLWK